MGLLGLANGGCSPDNDVKPGAPVLTMMSIVEPDGTRFDIKPEATLCAPKLMDGDRCDPTPPVNDGVCHTEDFRWCTCVPVPEPPPPPCMPDEADAGASDAAADAGTDGGVDAASNTGDAATDASSEAGAADGAASDAGDAGEVAPPKGTWSCKSFAPGSVVIATFDRLIDTAPLPPPDGAAPAVRDDIVKATIKTTVTPVPTTVTDYKPNGSTGGLIFPLFGENPGPNLKVTPQPSWPGSNVVTVALSKTLILAKDGKTPFASSGAITDGIISFQTVPFSASVSVPPKAFPPPEEMDAGADGGDAGSDAADAAADASDAGADDASDAGADANPDACVPPPPPPPEPMTALADMTPVKVVFNAPVDAATIASHVHIKADGQPYDDQVTVDVKVDPSNNLTTVTLTPMTAWAKSTTFDVTVDDKVVDVFGEMIMPGVTGTFTTGAK